MRAPKQVSGYLSSKKFLSKKIGSVDSNESLDQKKSASGRLQTQLSTSTLTPLDRKEHEKCVGNVIYANPRSSSVLQGGPGMSIVLKTASQESLVALSKAKANEIDAHSKVYGRGHPIMNKV